MSLTSIRENYRSLYSNMHAARSFNIRPFLRLHTLNSRVGGGANLFLGDLRLTRLFRLALVVPILDLDPDEFILTARR